MINEELYNLYQKYWDCFINNVYLPYNNLAVTKHDDSYKPAYPFLIKVTDHYQFADKRIMICGQETQGWGPTASPDIQAVDHIIHIYDSFVNKCEESTTTILKPGYNSPYWNFIWRIMKAFPTVGFVQQNVVKVGKANSAHCNEDINLATQEFFPVFMNELEILKPDLIIFLTGNYDWRILVLR